MEILVKTNCNNSARAEGYVNNIKFVSEEVNGRVKASLKFELLSVNEDDSGTAYITPFPVECYRGRAIEVNKFIREKMLVEVEGHMRLTPSGKFTLIGVYVKDATPRIKKINIQEE